MSDHKLLQIQTKRNLQKKMIVLIFIDEAVWLKITCVEEEVVAQIGLFAEAALADMALEGPAATVNVHVRFQIARRRKRFVAHGALVRLLLSISNSTAREYFVSQSMKENIAVPVISKDMFQNVITLAICLIRQVLKC